MTGANMMRYKTVHPTVLLIEPLSLNSRGFYGKIIASSLPENMPSCFVALIHSLLHLQRSFVLRHGLPKQIRDFA